MQSFVAAINELPTLWEALVQFDPRLKQVPGLESINALKSWIEEGELVSSYETTPNVLLSPLTIIIHIVQYFHFLRSNDCGATQSRILESSRSGGIQGFCTGLLSAIAVGCSKSEESISENAAVALRLAVCIGAYVDLDGAFADPPNEVMCFAVRWRSESQKDVLHSTIRSYIDVRRNTS